MRTGRGFVYMLAAVALLTVAPSASAAEPPPKFWKKCATGTGAGRCNVPRGIATSPTTGHLFIADQNNRRIVELTAWGEFIKAWGLGVKDGSPEFQVCTAESGCQQGELGSGKGELKAPQGVAVDSAGDIYVVDFNNHRVQKFSPAGAFIWMIGANVNKTKVDESATQAQRNICTEASGDECQAGTIGAGPGEFGNWPIASFIATDPPGSGTKIYVGDEGRVQEFEPNGAFIKELSLPGETVKSLAVDSGGNLYLALEGKNVVRKLDSSGVLLCEAALTNPVALAINPEGGFYAVAGSEPASVHQFGSACPLAESGPSFGSDELIISGGIATGSACFSAGFGLYLPSNNGSLLSPDDFIRAYGSVPDKIALCPRPPADPSITSQQVVAAEHEPPSSTVAAEINPHFWDDTTYYVEYGTGKCSEGGCTEKAPASPLLLGGGIVEEPIATAGVTLSGLQYGTTYHYRFIAESGGGGPVYGGDPDGEGPEEASFAKGTERYFRTIDPPVPGCPPKCLPDNRAFEQVSPTEKSSFDVNYGPVIARPDGEAVLYGSLGAFADPNAGAYSSTYKAQRIPTPWEAEALGPTVDPAREITSGQVLGVSGDLSKQLVLTNAKLAPEAVEEDNSAVNIYVHDSATDSYQYVDTAFGSGGVPQENVLLFDAFAGASYDGSSFYFVLNKQLDTVPAPPPVGTQQGLLYGFDTATGELSYLGVLPGGGVDPAGSFGAGAISNPGYSNGSPAFRAVSEDGSRVYWTHRGAGALYLYSAGQSTLVSEREADSSTQNAQLWGASADGDLALLTSGDELTEDASPAGADLYRYNADADQLTDLTAGKTSAGGAGVQKVLGVSEDGAYAYFIATWASGEEPAIYAWHEGDGIRLIGALASSATQLTLAETPSDLWRVSPNGYYLAFLFGGEIAGPAPQQSYPVREAYLYDYEEDSLSCASCPPGGLTSAAVTLHDSRNTGGNVGSLIPYTKGLTRNLTNTGQLFFQSKDRLLLADVNGAQDVYQYSATTSKVQLISTGQSPNDSFFGDATPSGSDAFFTTREQLVLQDQDGLVDLYDARVGGGIASQNEPPPVPCDPNVNCGGPITSPPTGPGPSTPGLIGPPDPVPPKCKAGFLRKGNKCVKAGHGKKAKKRHRHHAKRKRSRR